MWIASNSRAHLNNRLMIAKKGVMINQNARDKGQIAPNIAMVSSLHWVLVYGNAILRSSLHAMTARLALMG